MPLGTKIILTAAVVSAAVVASVLPFSSKPLARFPTISIALQTGKAIEISRDEITYALWMECVKSLSCQHTPNASAPTNGHSPVTDVNPFDIAEFTTWLKQTKHGKWRLPTREEWNDIASTLPKNDTPKLFNDPRMEWAADYYSRKSYARQIEPSGTFGTLKNGLRDAGGNVWEWTSSCVTNDTDGYMCPAYFVVGDHEAEIPIFLRDAFSGGCSSGVQPTNLGFRLVRDQSIF
jgi:formylglycine-generating enzyme required for sulfatase activity